MNPHSKLASFYRYFYLTEKLPNNLCNYCWGLVLAIICTPFVWPAIAINMFNKEIYLYEDKQFQMYSVRGKKTATSMGIVFSFFILVIGAVTIILLEKMDIINHVHAKNLSFLFILYLVGISTVAFSILMFYFFVAITRIIDSFKNELTEDEREAKYLAENRRYAEKYEKDWENKKYREANPRFYTLMWRWIVAIKEKNCPMITWDYTKKK